MCPNELKVESGSTLGPKFRGSLPTLPHPERPEQSGSYYNDHHGAPEFHNTYHIYNTTISDVTTTENSRAFAGVNLTTTSSPKQGEIRKWLSAADLESIRRRKRPAPGTCHWINSKADFMDWKMRKGPGFLWVHGIPGCGKSVLASSLIDTLQPDVFYFFCNRMHPDKRSPSSILRSLVSQMLGSATLKASPSVLDKVVNNIWEVCEMYPDVNKTSVDTLWKIFEAALEHFQRSIIIIDALDECELDGTDRDFLIKKLIRVQTRFPSLRMLATSRDMEELSSNSESLLAKIRIKKEDVQDDILTVVRNWVLRSSKLLMIQDRIISAVSDGSDGMILWAVMMLESLETATNVRSVSAKLERIPSGLGSIYSHILWEIAAHLTCEEQLLQSKILSWIVTAYRPLRICELSTALSIKPGNPHVSSDDMLLDALATVKRLCGPLVYITEDKSIQLVHLSVREALTETTDIELGYRWNCNVDKRFHIDKASFHGEAGEACLTYLKSPLLGDLQTHIDIVTQDKFAGFLAESLPFLDYASSNWPSHISEARPINQRMLSDVQRFLQSNHCFVWLECYSHFAARAPGEYGHHFQVQSTLREWINSFEDLPSGMEKAVNEYILQATEDGVFLAENRFGCHDLRTLSMMRRLSTLYCFSDRFLKARELRSAVLDGYKIKLGLSDSTTRRAFTDLGYVMYMLDDYVGAEENFYKALGGRDPSSWEMGPLEAETMKELATVYWLKNELPEARNMMEASLSGLIAHFTERHRLTVLCRQYLSYIYQATGDLEKALKVALDNRAISIAIQGDDHLDTLRGDLFIARLKMSADQLEDAEDLLTSVFYRQIRVLGRRNSETLMTRATLGIVLARKGENKAAEAAFREALVGTEEIFGAEHSSTKTIAAWLADFLSTNGQ